jgi:hypothetical protein
MGKSTLMIVQITSTQTLKANPPKKTENSGQIIPVDSVKENDMNYAESSGRDLRDRESTGWSIGLM